MSMTLVLEKERCLCPSHLCWENLVLSPDLTARIMLPHTPNSREEPAALAEGLSGRLGARSPKGSSEGALAGEIYFCPGSLASSPRRPIAWETCREGSRNAQPFLSDVLTALPWLCACLGARLWLSG